MRVNPVRALDRISLSCSEPKMSPPLLAKVRELYLSTRSCRGTHGEFYCKAIRATSLDPVLGVQVEHTIGAIYVGKTKGFWAKIELWQVNPTNLAVFDQELAFFEESEMHFVDVDVRLLCQRSEHAELNCAAFGNPLVHERFGFKGLSRFKHLALQSGPQSYHTSARKAKSGISLLVYGAEKGLLDEQISFENKTHLVAEIKALKVNMGAFKPLAWRTHLIPLLRERLYWLEQPSRGSGCNSRNRFTFEGWQDTLGLLHRELRDLPGVSLTYTTQAVSSGRRKEGASNYRTTLFKRIGPLVRNILYALPKQVNVLDSYDTSEIQLLRDNLPRGYSGLLRASRIRGTWFQQWYDLYGNQKGCGLAYLVHRLEGKAKRQGIPLGDLLDPIRDLLLNLAEV